MKADDRGDLRQLFTKYMLVACILYALYLVDVHNLMASLLQRIRLALDGTTPARRMQEEVDVGMAAVVVQLRRMFEGRESVNGSKTVDTNLRDAIAAVEIKTFQEQKQSVQNDITSRLEEFFKDFLPHCEMHGVNKKDRAVLSLSGYERETEQCSVNVKDILGFNLRVELSGIPDAGDGVMLQGRVPAGSLVCLYPGIVYLREHLKKPLFLEQVANNPYARARFDSVIINATNQPKVPVNPLAVGHMINHPPAHRSPNLIPFSYDFPLSEPFTLEEYTPLMPNSFVAEPSRLSMFGKRIVIHSLAFISARDLEDEELFINYRYNPNLPFPEWYTPADIQNDRLLWK